MTSSNIENKRVELVFPRPKREMDVYLPKKLPKGEEFFQIFSSDVDQIGQWFSQYEIDSIEVKINHIIDTAQTTKLLVGSNGENGLTVVLKPRKTSTDLNNEALRKVQRAAKDGGDFE
jgi:hypothetical protein